MNRHIDCECTHSFTCGHCLRNAPPPIFTPSTNAELLYRAIHRDRYLAFSSAGAALFGAPTASLIGDAVIAQLRAGTQPPVAYVRDTAPGVAFPFIVWRLSDAPFAGVGTPCRTIEEVRSHAAA